jgi:deoxyribodipyrimidine photo-lyase
VDAHNIVPCWQVCDKQEHAAWTLRRKLMPMMADYLTEFPSINAVHQQWPETPPEIDWQALARQMKDAVPKGRLPWAKAGPHQARLQLQYFINKLTSTGYHPNDANRQGQSNLSPYLHYGHVSPQRVALAVYNDPTIDQDKRKQFLEQMIVRRELSDNFCFYNADYNCFQGLPEWAQHTLNAHRSDPRPYQYSLQHFESGQTHDKLWNACQLDMVYHGKMPGYLRMYWGKKILEWSKDPETALAIATELNDRYEIDGRDPNGYVGIAWCIGGVHDHPWQERPIFGKVRYMTDKACKRQFNVAQYIATILGNS